MLFHKKVKQNTITTTKTKTKTKTTTTTNNNNKLVKRRENQLNSFKNKINKQKYTIELILDTKNTQETITVNNGFDNFAILEAFTDTQFECVWSRFLG